jgi:hypothetical protein
MNANDKYLPSAGESRAEGALLAPPTRRRLFSCCQRDVSASFSCGSSCHNERQQNEAPKNDMSSVQQAAALSLLRLVVDGNNETQQKERGTSWSDGAGNLCIECLLLLSSRHSTLLTSVVSTE